MARQHPATRAERTDRPVALLVALDEEAKTLVQALEPSTIPSPRISVWEGMVEGTALVLAITGVGKVSAALATQYVFDVFAPRCVIAIGLAGATHSDRQPGQMIIATGALQHDVDARPLTDARGTIPSLGIAVLPADPEWSEKLLQAAESVVERQDIVRSGVVLTGDQIVTSRDIRDRLVAEFPTGACFDMETAAVAQVARQNGIPWAALRLTSDASDESFNLDEVIGFGANTAADVFDKIVRAVLREL